MVWVLIIVEKENRRSYFFYQNSMGEAGSGFGDLEIPTAINKRR